MKRLVIGSLAALAALFALMITLRGTEDQSAAPSQRDTADSAERQRVREFWEVYRDATRHRTAGRLREAVERYQLALRLNEEHTDALYYLGNSYFALGEFPQAERSWRQLTALDPEASRGHSRLGELYFCFEQPEFFDLDRAEAEFQRAFEVHSGETGPLLQLGQIAVVRGNLDTAFYYFDAVIGTNFRSVPAHFFKGYAAWELGRSGEAVELFRQAALHARPPDVAADAPTEGDTKGGRAYLATSEHCTAFRSHAADLPDPDDSDLPSKARERYRQLNRFLTKARSSPSP